MGLIKLGSARISKLNERGIVSKRDGPSDFAGPRSAKQYCLRLGMIRVNNSEKHSTI